MNAYNIDWKKVDIDKIKNTPVFLYHGDSDYMIKSTYANATY
jgi:hypothetical protein